MDISVAQRCVAAGLIASCGLPSGVYAQSLALSYGLNVKSDSTYGSVSTVDRCAGVRWSASLAPSCTFRLSSTSPFDAKNGAVPKFRISEIDGATKGLPVVGGASSAAPYPSSESSPMIAELPLLGSPAADTRLLRVAGGKEALTGNVKTIDLMFRFGSKYRLRSGDEGWELYKFSDLASGGRLESNVKALGVELLVPFQ